MTRYGLVIDLERCVGCNTCAIACMMTHDLSEGSGITVKTIGGKDRDTPEGRHPELHMHFLPLLCMHCTDGPCVEACPNEAILQRPDGIVRIDESACDGCFSCLSACPYGVIVQKGEKESAFKCDMCAGRIDEGHEPFCVLCCEGEAMFFGNLDDPDSGLVKMVEDRGGKTLSKEAAAAVWYCPTREGRVE